MNFIVHEGQDVPHCESEQDIHLLLTRMKDLLSSPHVNELVANTKGTLYTHEEFLSMKLTGYISKSMREILNDYARHDARWKNIATFIRQKLQFAPRISAKLRALEEEHSTSIMCLSPGDKSSEGLSLAVFFHHLAPAAVVPYVACLVGLSGQDTDGQTRSPGLQTIDVQYQIAEPASSQEYYCNITIVTTAADAQALRRLYVANPKHRKHEYSTARERVSPMDLDGEVAQTVLDRGIRLKISQKIYGRHEDKVYIFPVTQNNEYHGFRSSEEDIRRRMADEHAKLVQLGFFRSSG